MTLMGMLNSWATRTASDLQPEFLPVQVQKGEVKLRASTSRPMSSIILTARVESSPPERRARALRFFIKELLGLHGMADLVWRGARPQDQIFIQASTGVANK